MCATPAYYFMHTYLVMGMLALGAAHLAKCSTGAILHPADTNGIWFPRRSCPSQAGGVRMQISPSLRSILSHSQCLLEEIARLSSIFAHIRLTVTIPLLLVLPTSYRWTTLYDQ